LVHFFWVVRSIGWVHRQYNLLTFIISFSFNRPFFFRIYSTNKQNLTFWQVCELL
jgi:hypothetical protein